MQVIFLAPASLVLVLITSKIVKDEMRSSQLRQSEERIATAGGYEKVTLSFLQSFAYVMPSDTQIAKKDFKNQFPEAIKALDNAKVAISGFMLPLYVEADGKVRKFMIIGSQTACCYGIYPPVNGWVEAEVDPKVPPMDAVRDVPVTVFGTLHIGEKIEDGRLTSIYQLDAEKQLGPSSRL